MARYILIDNNSGLVSGDSANFAPDLEYALTPSEAVKILDESLGKYDRRYVEHSSDPHDTSAGFHVYCATDANGSDIVPEVTDFEDHSAIESVRRNCLYVGYFQRAHDQTQERQPVTTPSRARDNLTVGLEGVK